MSKHVLVGRCIYCGTSSEKLTDEHWFPYALGGKDTLQKASCLNCAKIINERFEGRLLGYEFSNHRAKLGLPSRKSKKAKGHPVILKDILGRTFSVPAADFIALPLYRLSEAGVLCGRHHCFDNRAFTVTIADHGTFQAIMKKYPLWDKHLSISFEPSDTARLVAKTVHGWLISVYGLEAFNSFLPQVITGDISPQQLVGCRQRMSPYIKGKSLSVSGTVISNDTVLVIAYFDLYGGSTDYVFEVVCGSIDLNNPDQRKLLDIESAISTTKEFNSEIQNPQEVFENICRLIPAVQP